MDQYRHHVSGFFAHPGEAESALSWLVELGLPRERLHLFETDSAQPVTAQQTKSNEVLKDVLVDGAIGTAVGTGIGALAEVALVAANVSLFVASPLLAPLMLLGWGASLGGIIGAAAGTTAGAGNKEGQLADLVRDAISRPGRAGGGDPDGAGDDDRAGSHPGFGRRLQRRQHGMNAIVLMD